MTNDAETIRHLLVLANPSVDSFNHAIAERYRQVACSHHQQVEVRDLYDMNFDPVLRRNERPGRDAIEAAPDVVAELALLADSDILVLVYPIWFGLPPAMLKGFVDRVLGCGYSVDDLHDRTAQPAVAGKPLLSFSTSGASKPWLEEQGQVMSLRQIFDVYLWRGLGMLRSEHMMIDRVGPGMSRHYAEEQLEQVAQTAGRTCAMLASDRHAHHVQDLLDEQAERSPSAP